MKKKKMLTVKLGLTARKALTSTLDEVKGGRPPLDADSASVVLQFRVPESLKADFRKACENEDLEVSEAIRRLMADFIENA